MTDTTDTLSGAPAEDIQAHNKNLIFAALAEAGIHSVTIDYDRSGDSGQIESIEAWTATKEKIRLPSSRKLRLAFGNSDDPVTEIGLENAIEELACHYLTEIHMGREDNDGAFGTFVFDVPNRTVTLEHNERYTEVNTTSHEF